MGKEMTPLEALERIIQYNDLRNPVRGQTDLIYIIETALKNNEHLEKEICFVKTMEDLTIEAMKDKKLKALEIIKEKNVFVWGFIHRKEEIKDFEYTYYYYKKCYGYFHSGYDYKLLTEEEFNLLKEVLL